MLETSISALSVSPRTDCTLSRPKPKAQAGVLSRQLAAKATPVSAKRPALIVRCFKASPKNDGRGST